MPNHVINIVTFQGDEKKIAEALEAIQNDEYGLGTIDFNKIIPMPESLNITAGSQTSKGLEYYKKHSLRPMFRMVLSLFIRPLAKARLRRLINLKSISVLPLLLVKKPSFSRIYSLFGWNTDYKYRMAYSWYSREYSSLQEFCVWERWNETMPVPEGYVMIFGHTPTCHFQHKEPWSIWKSDNAIGIDCGAGYPDGRLACLRLDDMKKFYSEV